MDNDKEKTLIKIVFAVGASAGVHVLYTLFAMSSAFSTLLFDTDFRWYHWLAIGATGAIVSLDILLGRVFRSSGTTSRRRHEMLLRLAIGYSAQSLRKAGFSTNRIALSITYLNHMKRKHGLLKVQLLSSLIALIVVGKLTHIDEVLRLSLTPLIPLGLLILQEAVIEYRIKIGLFGNNAREARNMIDFLIRNSEDLDFHDGSGKLRRVLLDTGTQSMNIPGLAGREVGA